MQYALLIYEPADSFRRTLPPEQQEKIYGEYMKYSEDLQNAGVVRGGAPLQTTDTATTVRQRDGKAVDTDGPFAETKEWLAGFFLIECKDLNEALAWAKKIPGVKYGASVEVRPLMEIPERVSR
ncbi:MAG: YciI family protein [Vulcanimicrobiaceae bacterium]